MSLRDSELADTEPRIQVKSFKGGGARLTACIERESLISEKSALIINQAFRNYQNLSELSLDFR